MQNKNEFLIFCKNIRLLREKYNFSKKEMAKILGISEKTLSLIENDIVIERLSSKVIFRTARYFGIQPAYLFHEEKIKTFLESEVFQDKFVNK